jgi:uncharacterized protein YjbI with pentapeptide repeats
MNLSRETEESIRSQKRSARIEAEIYMSQLTRKKRLISFIFVAILLPTLSIYYSKLYTLEWSGFGPDSNKSKTLEKNIKDGKVISLKEIEAENFQSAKTLWDWLGLSGTLAIPVVLFQFQRGEQRRSEERAKLENQQTEMQVQFEQGIAANNLREEVLQGYIDRMSELLIDQGIRTELLLDKTKDNDSNQDNPVRDVARIRTITILRRLEGDTERQDRVLHFLRDAELLEFLLSHANLKSVNLSNTDLRGINLTNADFTFANLRGANLKASHLHNTNLTSADLTGANLSGAFLTQANLNDANLQSANLEGAWVGCLFDNGMFCKVKLDNANLDQANLQNIRNYKSLSGAAVPVEVSPEQITVARNWNKAIYDQELCHRLGLPKRQS